jgi:hypothetical protein
MLSLTQTEIRLNEWKLYERDLQRWEAEREQWKKTSETALQWFEENEPRPVQPKFPKPEPREEPPPVSIPKPVTKVPEPPKPKPEAEVPKPEPQDWDKKLFDWWQKAYPAFQRLCKAQGIVEPTEEQIQEKLAESWGLQLAASPTSCKVDSTQLAASRKPRKQQENKADNKDRIVAFVNRHPEKLYTSQELLAILDLGIKERTIQTYLEELSLPETGVLDYKEVYSMIRAGFVKCTRYYSFKGNPLLAANMSACT